MKRKEIDDGRIMAVYVRRSVSDAYRGNNSLSIQSQKEECIKYVGDKPYKLYCDDGKSGKDIEHRPQFQMMMQDARDGLISTIVVKKYDRFSRNMREYLNITDELDKCNVSVVSLSEPFNTETKEGRMMRNNLLNFAEFERETIAARVADAYNTKARETGFYQGGHLCLGFDIERRTVNGKTGSVLVPNSKADAVRLAYDLYANKNLSLREIIEYFREHSVDVTLDVSEKRSKTGKTNMSIGWISRILSSPLYVKADKDIYKHFSSIGYIMLDNIESYDGLHGLFLHQDPNSDNKFVKLGYHDGIVDSKVWLTVFDRKSRQRKFYNTQKVKTSFLSGMIKCSHCKYGIVFHSSTSKYGKTYVRLEDSGAYRVAGCKMKMLKKIRVNTLEQTVFQEMKKRIETYEVKKYNDENINQEKDRIDTEIVKIDIELEKLAKRIADADDVTYKYIKQRINELHNIKSELEIKYRVSERRTKDETIDTIVEPFKNWDKLTVEEKHAIAANMIDVIYVSDETGIDIRFSI